VRQPAGNVSEAKDFFVSEAKACDGAPRAIGETGSMMTEQMLRLDEVRAILARLRMSRACCHARLAAPGFACV